MAPKNSLDRSSRPPQCFYSIIAIQMCYIFVSATFLSICVLGYRVTYFVPRFLEIPFQPLTIVSIALGAPFWGIAQRLAPVSNRNNLHTWGYKFTTDQSWRKSGQLLEWTHALTQTISSFRNFLQIPPHRSKMLKTIQKQILTKFRIFSESTLIGTHRVSLYIRLLGQSP